MLLMPILCVLDAVRFLYCSQQMIPDVYKFLTNYLEWIGHVFVIHSAFVSHKQWIIDTY